MTLIARFLKNNATMTHFKMKPNNKVSDIVKRIPTCLRRGDVYVMGEEKVLRRGEELRKCGVSKGSAVQVVRRVRGGERHEVTRRELVTSVGRATPERRKETNRHVKRRRPLKNHRIQSKRKKASRRWKRKNRRERRRREKRRERRRRERRRDIQMRKAREEQPREARTLVERNSSEGYRGARKTSENGQRSWRAGRAKERCWGAGGTRTTAKWRPKRGPRKKEREQCEKNTLEKGYKMMQIQRRRTTRTTCGTDTWRNGDMQVNPCRQRTRHALRQRTTQNLASSHASGRTGPRRELDTLLLFPSKTCKNFRDGFEIFTWFRWSSLTNITVAHQRDGALVSVPLMPRCGVRDVDRRELVHVSAIASVNPWAWWQFRYFLYSCPLNTMVFFFGRPLTSWVSWQTVRN